MQRQNDEVETGCGSQSHSIQFGSNMLQKRSEDSKMMKTGPQTFYEQFEEHQNLIDEDRVVHFLAATRVPGPEVVQIRQHEY